MKVYPLASPGQQSMSPVSLCGNWYKNSEMAPAKLKKYFITRYSLLTLKGANYFKQILAFQTEVFILKSHISENSQEASNLVTKRIAQRRKSHTIGENLIMSACKMREIKMLGQDAVWGFGKVPLWNSKIDMLVSYHIMPKKFCVIIWKTTAPLPGWQVLRFPQ